MFDPTRLRSGLAILALAGSLGLAACGGSGDESSTAASSSATSTTGSSGTGASSAAEVDWPLFGRIEERTHYIADAPDPPFHFLWQFFAKQLIEFPPVLQNDFLFVVNKTGDVFVLDAATGKAIRKANVADDVTGPAYAHGTLYLAQLNGTLTALDPQTGKPRWSFKAASDLESSPLVVDDTVYFGSDDGDLYALRTSDGKVDWHVQLGHDVKASPSFHDGTVYVGDYEGTVWALDASSGKTRWSTDTTTLPPGGDGGFYSSPSVAFGHVYEARTDGTVYALGQASGKLAWQFQTSNSIYSSPAAAQVPGTEPTVYVGSYDHQLYALDAATGRKRWVFNVGGVIPGTPTVVGETVYTSSFQTKKTVGLDAKTGKPVFHWGSAGFTPVISDGERVFLTGFQTIWAFDAKHPGQQPAQSAGEAGPAPKPPGPNNADSGAGH